MNKGPTPEEIIAKIDAEGAVADVKIVVESKEVKEVIPEVKPEPEITPTPEVKSEPEVKPVISKELAQKRIDRMYARLQAEREKNLNTDNALKLSDIKKTAYDEGPRPMTQVEVEAIWNRKENEKKFKDSEMRVLLRHPDALNDDGTFNMDSDFTKTYIETGRNNPNLAFMTNGPELAEALVEKNLGIHYKKGVQDGAISTKKVANVHTGASTIAVTGDKIAQLPDFKKKIAARMGMTEKDYMDYEQKIKSGDKRVK